MLVAMLCMYNQLSQAQQQPAVADPIPIVSYNDQVNPDGSFAYSYETGNGIKVDASGSEQQQSGNVKYTDPNGNPVEWSYVADVNGYQPQGSAIPAIPEHVARALQYIKEHSTTAAPTR